MSERPAEAEGGKPRSAWSSCISRDARTSIHDAVRRHRPRPAQTSASWISGSSTSTSRPSERRGGTSTRSNPAGNRAAVAIDADSP
jgi:hypothetical protein